jgi:hypothetical protein
MYYLNISRGYLEYNSSGIVDIVIDKISKEVELLKEENPNIK